MGLDHGDRVGHHAALCQGVLEGMDLSVFPALALSVHGDPHPAQQRIDAVAVAAGVLQALEDEQPPSFAEQRTVGIAAEGVGDGMLRQVPQMAEGHHQLRGEYAGQTAGEGHIGAPCAELVHRGLQGRQRRGAGRIDHVAGALQIEPLGQSREDRAVDEPEGVARVVLRKTLLQVLAQGLESLGAAMGKAAPHKIEGLVDDHALLHPVDRGRIHVRGVAEDHGGALPRRALVGIPGIPERLGREIKDHRVLRVGAREGRRGEPHGGRQCLP